MQLRPIAAALAVVALAIPAAATAQGRPAGAGGGSASKAALHPIAYRFAGTVVAVVPATDGPAAVVVQIAHVNHRQASLVGTELTFAVGAKTVVTRRGSGRVALDTLAEGDPVMVVARAPRVVPEGFAWTAKPVHDRVAAPLAGS